MTARTFAVVAVTCVVVSTRLLASSALLDAPVLAMAGLLPLLVLPLAKRRLEQRDRDAERERRRPRTNPAMLQGSAFVVAGSAGLVNGKYPLALALLVGGLAGIVGGWWAKRRSPE